MKTTTLLLGALSFYLSAIVANAATIFTYQGRLATGQTAANGLYEMQFALFDAATNGNPVGSGITLAPVPVTNGIFTVGLDFGSAAFTGAPRWLEISLTLYGSDQPVTTLYPRQRITSTPYAILADNVSGPIPDSQLSSNIARLNGPATFAGLVTASEFAGNGSGIANVNAALLGGLAANDFWKLGGNSGTDPATIFLGTTDQQPLEFRVNGVRAFRLEPTTNGAPNVVGGSVRSNIITAAAGAVIAGGDQNTIGPECHYSQISGGMLNTIYRNSRYASIGGGQGNRIDEVCHSTMIGGGESNSIAFYSSHTTIGGGKGNGISHFVSSSTIGGGEGNAIRSYAHNSVVAGGANNDIQGFSKGSAIGGGVGNVIYGQTENCAIGGGYGNYISAFSASSTIGGGFSNQINLSSQDSTIAGGAKNIIQGYSISGFSGCTIGGGVLNSNYGHYATIPGGLANYAAESAFAAGTRARAAHVGTFVWSDPSPDAVSSTSTNQFTARASGGVRFFTDAAATTGAELAPGSGSWSSLSDRNAKTNFTAIAPRDVLERVAGLPIQQWSYKSQDPSVRHVGPTAQDFHAAFGVGEDATRISSVDADGVALAAIQGLHSLLKEKDIEIENLKQRLAAIEAVLSGPSRVLNEPAPVRNDN